MQKDKKKVHKDIVKYLREVNKNISNDDYLGKNRFGVSMWSENMYRYPDDGTYYSSITFKLIDHKTNNCAYFMADNFDFKYKLVIYLNDFMIRCSMGREGHTPQLPYIAYDVHEIVPYKSGDEVNSNDSIATYNYTNYKLL